MLVQLTLAIAIRDVRTAYVASRERSWSAIADSFDRDDSAVIEFQLSMAVALSSTGKRPANARA